MSIEFDVASTPGHTPPPEPGLKLSTSSKSGNGGSGEFEGVLVRVLVGVDVGISVGVLLGVLVGVNGVLVGDKVEEACSVGVDCTMVGRGCVACEGVLTNRLHAKRRGPSKKLKIRANSDLKDGVSVRTTCISGDASP